MANNNSMTLVIKEAARILGEKPHLKHYEAIIEAKLMIKEKELSDGNLKSSKGKKIN